MFYPYGPFEIPRQTKSRIDGSKKATASFWDLVEKKEPGLSAAVGCYIFSIRAGRGALPWYIGLAEKQSFNSECFALHKLYLYNETITSRRGTPLLTLVPKFTATDRFAKRSKNGHGDIGFLENMLIGMALQRNPKLVNIRQTALRRNMIVHGMLHTPRGRQAKAVDEFQSLMGVD